MKRRNLKKFLSTSKLTILRQCPNMKRTKPSNSREKEKKLICTTTASETGIETYQAETEDDLIFETDFNIVDDMDTIEVIDEEYAEIETSFRSLLEPDYPTRTETPGDSYENNEVQDCMFYEIHAHVLPMENDDPINDEEEMYEFEELDKDLTINLESKEQMFPIPSKPISETSHSIDDDQPVCNKSQLTIPALMTLLALFTVKYHLPGEAITHLLTLISLALPAGHNLSSTLKSFKAYFRSLNSPFNFHYYCSFCFAPLNSKHATVCPNSAFFRI